MQSHKAETINVAFISMCSRSDRRANIELAFSQIRAAAVVAPNGWVMLPEVFTYVGAPGTLPDTIEHDSSELLMTLGNLAKELGIVIFAGTVHERDLNDPLEKPFNTSYVFGRDGRILAKYRKAHLFRLTHPKAGVTLDESKTFRAGSELTMVEIDGYNVALSICYDLRFSEFYASFRKIAGKEGPDVIVAPSAFTKITGEAHWEVLNRARAIEGQCYVLACNQTGLHAPGRASFGHSIGVDPWGVVIANAGSQEGIFTCQISRSKIAEARQKIPIAGDRRGDLY